MNKKKLSFKSVNYEKKKITLKRYNFLNNQTMLQYKKELEMIANDILNQNAEAKGNENKPNYTNRDFMNTLIIFQTALMDKMYDNQEYDKMGIEDRLNMARSCGLDLRKLIHTYTNLDTHKFEDFV